MRKFEQIGALFVLIGFLPSYEQISWGGPAGKNVVSNTTYCSSQQDTSCNNCFSSSGGTCTANKYLDTPLQALGTSAGTEISDGMESLPCYWIKEYEAGTGGWGYRCNPTGGCEQLGGLFDPNAYVHWCYAANLRVAVPVNTTNEKTKPRTEG